MKKLIFLFFVLGFVAMFFGCADVTYTVMVNNEGEICQEVVVCPDYSVLEQNGFSKNTVNERVVTIFNEVCKNQQTQFKNHKSLFVTESQKEQILKRVENSYIFENDKIILRLSFKNFSDYIYYNCMETKELTSTEQIKKTPFVYFTSSTTNNAFCELNQSSLTSFVEQMFKSVNENINFKFDDLTYHYIYLTSDDKQRSDADEIYYTNGLYAHKWNFDKNNLSKKINFYKYTHIVTANWYYVALVGSALFFVVLVLLSGIKHNKQLKGEKND